MDKWQQALQQGLDTAHNEDEVFGHVLRAAQALGFEFAAYGLRLPVPFAKPAVLLLNNYPKAWRQRYVEQALWRVDPTVARAQHDTEAFVWEPTLHDAAAPFWRDAHAMGLRHGWCQPRREICGTLGLLTLARSSGEIDVAELQRLGPQLRWLADSAHSHLSELLVQRQWREAQAALTGREVEVLRWTADGKTAPDISRILDLSVDTVNFHMRNAMGKLQASTKTAAAVRATMLGLLTR
ncbi:LuxR family transcriptional regulator [Roseateles sp. BYS180W]|uniref:LuxR family transcriptional regulator n=1 Tax=Roseateles rivi TaxID=3299028 RepID=A0ABW7FTY7_9BURK